MPRKPFDPLSYIPSPRALKEKLTETRKLSRRLSILLKVAEKLEATKDAADGKAVSRV